MADSPDRLTDGDFDREMLRTWLDTRMERDRTLVALSAGGIGGLVTLLTTVGPGSVVGLVIYILSGAAFAIALGCGVAIFQLNAAHLERVIKSKERGKDERLELLDLAMVVAFAVGVVCAGAIGVRAGIEKLSTQRQEAQVANERAQTRVSTPDSTRSISGAGGLRPTATPQPASTGGSAGGGTQGSGSGGSGGSSGSSGSSGSGNAPSGGQGSGSGGGE